MRILFAPDPPDGGGGDPAPTPTPEPTPVVFAGKYHSPEDLESGFSELRTAMGLDKIDTPLVGDKGLYRDHVALERGYKDLAAIQSRGKPKDEPKPPAAPAPDLNVDPAKDDPIDVGKIISASGLDLAALETQYKANGKLTDEQYAAIRKADPSLANVKTGVLKAMVDSAAKGMLLEAETVNQAKTALHDKLAAKVGVNREELSDRLKVMGASVPAAERAGINKALADPELAELAVEKIVAYHRAATGAGDGTIPGDGGAGATGAIRSYADLRKAITESDDGNVSARKSLSKMSHDQILAHGRF